MTAPISAEDRLKKLLRTNTPAPSAPVNQAAHVEVNVGYISPIANIKVVGIG